MRHATSVTVLAVLAGLFLMPTFSLTAAEAAGAHRHDAAAGHSSPYAGEEKRDIKTLSAADIDDLRNGRGWGFAKAAELNGLPGPTHLLEMKTEIALSPAQIEAVETLFAEMKAAAVPLGARLVEVRGDLRFVHLATHLRTPALLSAAQIADYNRLRGYDLQPSSPPSGHRHGK
ncbi:MAG: hypothetical protein ACTSRY_06545 [Alphaproteobacteria bacterium]